MNKLFLYQCFPKNLRLFLCKEQIYLNLNELGSKFQSNLNN